MKNSMSELVIIESLLNRYEVFAVEIAKTLAEGIDQDIDAETKNRIVLLLNKLEHNPIFQFQQNEFPIDVILSELEYSLKDLNLSRNNLDEIAKILSCICIYRGIDSYENINLIGGFSLEYLQSEVNELAKIYLNLIQSIESPFELKYLPASLMDHTEFINKAKRLNENKLLESLIDYRQKYSLDMALYLAEGISYPKSTRKFSVFNNMLLKICPEIFQEMFKTSNYLKIFQEHPYIAAGEFSSEFLAEYLSYRINTHNNIYLKSFTSLDSTELKDHIKDYLFYNISKWGDELAIKYFPEELITEDIKAHFIEFYGDELLVNFPDYLIEDSSFMIECARRNEHTLDHLLPFPKINQNTAIELLKYVHPNSVGSVIDAANLSSDFKFALMVAENNYDFKLSYIFPFLSMDLRANHTIAIKALTTGLSDDWVDLRNHIPSAMFGDDRFLTSLAIEVSKLDNPDCEIFTMQCYQRSEIWIKILKISIDAVVVVPNSFWSNTCFIEEYLIILNNYLQKSDRNLDHCELYFDIFQFKVIESDYSAPKEIITLFEQLYVKFNFLLVKSM